MDNQGLADDMRSHVSHFSGVTGKIGKPRYLDTQCVAIIIIFLTYLYLIVSLIGILLRSIADGQSQHSFSNQSHRGYLGTAFPSNLVNSRPGM